MDTDNSAVNAWEAGEEWKGSMGGKGEISIILSTRKIDLKIKNI